MNTCMTDRDGVGLPQPGEGGSCRDFKGVRTQRRFYANIIEFEMEKYRQ